MASTKTTSSKSTPRKVNGIRLESHLLLMMQVLRFPRRLWYGCLRVPPKWRYALVENDIVAKRLLTPYTIQVIPTRQLAALSIAPSTPRRLSRRRTHTFQSPPSSLESTPEADESIRFSPFDSDVRFSDTPELPRFSLALPLPPLPLPVRGHSFDFSALLNESANRFGDIGVPSRRLDIFN